MSRLAAAELALIAGAYGPEQARRCDVGQCTHTHRLPPAAAPPAALVDLRCPDDMGKLLGRTAAASFHADGVVELACNNCARAYRRAGLDVRSVLHRFNLLGELLATEILPNGEAP